MNDSPEFISALADLVEMHSGGWPVQRRAEVGRDVDDAQTVALKARKERAVALGAES